MTCILPPSTGARAGVWPRPVSGAAQRPSEAAEGEEVPIPGVDIRSALETIIGASHQWGLCWSIVLLPKAFSTCG